MAESFEEQLDRVKSMASGSATWDLSHNDIAALKVLLAERAELVAIAELSRSLSLNRRDPDEARLDDALAAYFAAPESTNGD